MATRLPTKFQAGQQLYQTVFDLSLSNKLTKLNRIHYPLDIQYCLLAVKLDYFRKALLQ
jgi:hypothetical protein